MDSMAGFVLTLSRLGVGAIGTFFAILLWSQTRDAAWVLVIIGTLVAYAEVVFSTLEGFGIVPAELLQRVRNPRAAAGAGQPAHAAPDLRLHRRDRPAAAAAAQRLAASG